MTPSERLAALRAALAARGLGGFIVPHADETLGEYLPACAERLAWLTGFTGSAGLAAILPTRAVVFTDGRYVLQLARQTDPELWQRRHIIEDPPERWLARHADGAPLGYDPRLMSEETVERFTAAGLRMTPVEDNPLDAIWTDRPPPPRAAALPHPLEFAGKSAAEKCREVAAALAAAGQDATIITDAASIAWLFNIRGGDVPFTPFALGFAILRADGGAALFMDPAKLPPETRAWLGETVTIAPPDALASALRGFGNRTVRVDRAGTSAWFAQTLRGAGAKVVAGVDPSLLARACKNPTEQNGARAAHRRDAIAVCRFLRWLQETAPIGRETEISAARKLLALRAEADEFRGESFAAISGAGPNGAIIHYRVTEETDRALNPGEPYLIDSGAQYPDGTTDITRTVWVGPDAPPYCLADRFTRVLQGHIAIATLVFPEGVAGPHIDAFARRALWQAGLDFDHGTGHGVGSYLSVHEGPASISRAGRLTPIAAGMILSNEPGFYLPDHYGIRLENLLLVRPAAIEAASKPFLRFETLTLAPFDRRLIRADLLTPAERAWLDAYHACVFAEIGPLLDPPTRAWLATACAALAE